MTHQNLGNTTSHFNTIARSEQEINIFTRLLVQAQKTLPAEVPFDGPPFLLERERYGLENFPVCLI